MSDGTNKEIPVTTSKFVTEQATDPYCRELANTLGKQGSVYSDDRNVVLIISA